MLKTAINFQLPNTGDTVPDWLLLIPAGELEGIDGRRWLHDSPETVLQWFRARNRPLPFDWEHSSELLAPRGQEAPAAGWIEELEIRDGAIWGRVEWTERAANQIRGREYRYYSPAFDHTSDLHVVRLSSVALTNRPNLTLTALNREEPPMPLPLALAAALGLAADATEQQAVDAATKLKGDLQTALNSANAQPALDRYVPRADYDAVLQRATNAEAKVREVATAQLEAAIDSEIQSALTAGKITPATEEYHRASCRQEGGLERFKAYTQAAPTIAPADVSPPGNPDGEKRALNQQEKEVAARLGIPEEEFLKAR